MTVLDGSTALRRAIEAFEQRLRLVGEGDWSRPTPCSEWDVRDLVNHVIGGNRRYTMLLHGASAAEVTRTRGEDHLGEDPVAAFTATADALTQAFAEDGALARIAHHPAGDRSGSELLAMRVLDLTVHAWDLTRALDVDDVLDSGAVEYSLAHAEVIEAGREHGSYAAPVAPATSQAPPQVRLLHLAGRSSGGRQS